MKKDITRRKLLKDGLIYGSLLPFMGSYSCQNNAAPQAIKLNILILGGTSFLGPHQISYAMGRGHQITTFTRGKTKPTIHQELFEKVTMLTGDRNSDISALKNKEWDVVIDNSGHNVEWTKNSADLLKDHCGMYIYTSSTGVYYPYLSDDINEGTKPLLVEPENIEDEEMKIEYWYGVMKANSEIQAKNAFGDNRTLIVRPTYMIGPADKSHRFIHWPIRLSRGGDILVPGKRNDPVQYIDVRDVAEWMVRMAENGNSGTYNAVGPKTSESISQFAAKAVSSFKVESNLIQIDDYAFLKSQGVKDIVPWIMPEGNNYGSARINNILAQQDGLTYRTLNDSLKDTLEWWNADSVPQEFRNKYLQDPNTVLAKEASILKTWLKMNLK